MKKSIVALGLAVMVMALSSCSYYSCPTYAKKQPKEKPAEKTEQRYL